MGYQALGVSPEETPEAFNRVNLAYAGGALGITLGLLRLGLAAYRERALPGVWRSVPLGVGVVWFPLEALAASTPDGWGVIAGGVAWMLAAYASRARAPGSRAIPLLAGRGGRLCRPSARSRRFH